MWRSSARLAVLRERSFRLLLGAQGISWFGDRIVTVALAFAVLELDDSPSALGLVLLCRSVPLLGCLLFGGVVADRVSRRAVMVTADVVRVASQGLTAALLIIGAAEVWSVAALAAVAGAASGFFNPAATGLLPLVVTPEQLQPANGIRATAMSAGEIAGPVLSGVLVAAFGAGWAIAVDAATYAVSAVLLARLRVTGTEARAEASFVADLREGWTTFRSYTWVWSFVLWAAMANLVWGAWRVLGPVVSDRELGGSAAWGTITGAMGIGALVGALAAIRAAPRRPLLAVAWTAFAGAVPLALLASGAATAPIAVGAILIGFGIMFGNTVWEATLQRQIPTALLSRVSAYDWFGSFAFEPIGLAIWGPIAALIGITDALWLAAALVLVSALALLAVRDVRHLEAVPSEGGTRERIAS